MNDPRPAGSNHGMTFAFSKTFVCDLDAMAKFYETVLGLIPFNRHQDAMFGRDIDEITYQATYPGGPALTLISYTDGNAPAPGEAVQGFVTPDLEQVCERAKANGGSVPEGIREVPEFGLKVAFIIDPEGRINEVIEMLGQ